MVIENKRTTVRYNLLLDDSSRAALGELAKASGLSRSKAMTRIILSLRSKKKTVEHKLLAYLPREGRVRPMNFRVKEEVLLLLQVVAEAHDLNSSEVCRRAIMTAMKKVRELA